MTTIEPTSPLVDDFARERERGGFEVATEIADGLPVRFDVDGLLPDVLAKRAEAVSLELHASVMDGRSSVRASFDRFPASSFPALSG